MKPGYDVYVGEEAIVMADQDKGWYDVEVQSMHGFGGRMKIKWRGPKMERV